MVCTLSQQKVTQQYHYLYLNDHNDICEAVALQHVQGVPKGIESFICHLLTTDF